MTKNYDGWTIKTKKGRLLVWAVSDTRTEIIQEKAGEAYWEKRMRRGDKIVKVKLIEVK